MTSSYSDSVMSFDLGYLQQPSSNISISSALKCRRNIAKIKSKILSLNAVVDKCTEQSEIIEATSKSLFASKEECKQLCINYKNVLDKCENLQNDINTLQIHNQQLHHKLTDAENQYCGMQSLAKQLEVLAKEREIQIESLTAENNLEKANSKKFASRATSLQKRNERLLRDVCKFGNFLMGNQRLPAAVRETLNRYSKYLKEDTEDSCHDSNGDHSDNDIDVFSSDNLKTSKSPHDINKSEVQKSPIEIQEMIVVNLDRTEKENTSNYKLDELDRYSDCSNEIASADTGRGSSLAFSDSEKCFLSPDSFIIDNHGSPEIISKTTKETSPKRVVETTDIATSPLRIETPIIPKITIDQAVGPDEPINYENEPSHPNSIASEIMSTLTTIDASIQNDTNAQEVQFTDVQGKECLQVNSSNHYSDEDNTGNYEVEMILEKMKFNRELITPIPSSPSRHSVTSEVSASQTDNSIIAVMSKQIQILLANQSKMIKAIVNLKKQNMNSTSKQPDISPNKEKSNVDKDISELNQLSLLTNIDVEEREESLNENNDNVDILKPHDNNGEDTEKRQHGYDCVQSVQSQIENDPESDDLIDMDDLIQICHSESMALNDFSTPISQELMNAEDITDTWSLNAEVEHPINIIEEEENSSERMIGRLEFEEDVNCASPRRPSDVNKETLETPEKIASDNCPPATKMANCNDRIKRKMCKLNNLEKLRRKMTPKCKIQREKVLARRPRVQKHIGNCIRRPNVKLPKKKITAADSSASLNNKTVYDNAVRIMSELKSKRSKEPIHKSVFKSNRTKKAKNIRLIKPRSAEVYPKSAKKQCDTSELSPGKLTTTSNEKPFDISDLMSKLTQKPIIKSLTTKSQNKSTEIPTQTCQLQLGNNQSLKLMQPVILIDRLQEKRDFGREIPCDKTDTNTSKSSPPNTRSRNRCFEKPLLVNVDPSTAEDISPKDCRKRLKRISSADNQDIEQKRILRSSTRQLNFDENLNEQNISHNLVNLSNKDTQSTHSNSLKLRRSSDDTLNSTLDNSKSLKLRKCSDDTLNSSLDNLKSLKLIKCSNDTMNSSLDNSKSPQLRKCSEDTKNPSLDNVFATTYKTKEHNISITYDDLDMFDNTEIKKPESRDIVRDDNPKNSILCTMIEKYTLNKVNYFPKKISDHATDSIVKLIEEKLETIGKLPPSETRKAMDDLVEKLRALKWKDFTAAFMKYLQDPERKVELYSKVFSPPAPPMTKNEQILLYVFIKLRNAWPEVDIVNSILCQMEYILFKINQTPEFDVIESMSHFYAAICRCFGMKIRLRSFMLDAMYCLQFKAIALVKQCIDVWMHVIPLAHIGIAKNPLVTCLVYLLHFYKCEDHFNRVQDIRNILHRKYFYQMSEWNEKRILEVVKNAIYEVKVNPEEKKILRRSLLILAKRQGSRWCQKNIIMNMLLPIIEKENSPENVKLFCIGMLGPLMKPYPPDMKVHCEIVMNSLMDIAKQKPSPATQEAVFCSLISMSKHNHTRVTNALLSWHPKHKVSPECYAVMRDFVREKPAHAWRRALSKAYLASEVEMGRPEDSSERD